jgi:N utilization substance protein B
MASRHRSRQRAAQVLYQWDMRKQPIGDAINAFYHSLYSEEGEGAPEPDPFMEELARGTAERAAEIDRQISRHSEHWRLERMPAVDRNILRLAIFEMRQGTTPPVVVIDEALEIARRFSGAESISFINGVLDSVRRDLEGSSKEDGGAAP